MLNRTHPDVRVTSPARLTYPDVPETSLAKRRYPDVPETSPAKRNRRPAVPVTVPVAAALSFDDLVSIARGSIDNTVKPSPQLTLKAVFKGLSDEDKTRFYGLFQDDDEDESNDPI